MAGEQKQNISDLLHRLNSPAAGAAWAAFIDRYSAMIMKVLSQFEYGQHRGNECFLYVCEKLCDQQFQRLQKFNTAGPASFRNWLATVVFNLCVDWHRKEFGRATVLPAIAALPAFDQLVYRYRYELGMDLEACYQTIKADFPELSNDQFSGSLQRIHSLLTPRQRWQLSVRNRGPSSARPDLSSARMDQIKDPGASPDFLAQTEEEVASLQAALSRLTTDQRLLLHLRFQEGLTFRKIAQLEQLGGPHRARRHIQAALDALYIQFQRVFSEQKRQN